MNWKFWQKPTATVPLEVVPLQFDDPEWPAKLAALKDRLAVTQPDEPLLSGLLGLLDANVRVETQTLASVVGLPNEEAQRFRGRIGMLLDLKAELVKLHREARAKALSPDDAGKIAA